MTTMLTVPRSPSGQRSRAIFRRPTPSIYCTKLEHISVSSPRPIGSVSRQSTASINHEAGHVNARIGDLPTMTARIMAVCEGLPLREVARLTGVSHETARRYSKGEDPSIGFIVGLSRAFGVSCHWLLTGHGPIRVEGVNRLEVDRDGTGQPVAGLPPHDLIVVLASKLREVEARLAAIERNNQEASPEHQKLPMQDLEAKGEAVPVRTPKRGA